MSNSTIFRSTLIGAFILAGAQGCVVEAEPDEADFIDIEAAGEISQQASTRGIVTGNGALLLTPEIVTLYTPVAKLLTLTPLTAGAIEANDLLGVLPGRTFLHYLVQCALPQGESITANFLGLSHTFEGHVGIAPEWATGALSQSSRRWLSACVLAHINFTTEQVDIFLRGNHPALASAVAPEGNEFSLREGVFYGDIFALVPAMHACPGVGSVPERVCTSSVAGLSLCGLLVPGACTNVCTGLTNGVYSSCRSSSIPLLSTSYSEVITVYLRP